MQLLTGLAPHQVLQRNRRGFATVVASGRAAASGPVFATVTAPRGRALISSRRVGFARGGHFSIRLSGLPVGGPYRIELRCASTALVVADIRVGDIWLLAGQSNMQGYGDLATAPRCAPDVFARSMAGVWGPAEEPLHVLEESPDPVHTAAPLPPARIAALRRAAVVGAGPALAFAAELARRTSVPQGLIPCAHGGTSLAQWNPALKKQGGRSLYGSLHRAWLTTSQPVAGLLWYQGESDADPENREHYTDRFTRLVRDLRRDLCQPRLPVLTVQLARVVGDGAPEKIRSWNRVQEQQRRLPALLPAVGVVAAVDLPLVDNIHLSGAAQQRLGVRLARLASRLVHRDRAEPPPPRIVGVKRLAQRTEFASARCYEVSFAHVVGGLRGFVEQAFTFVDAEDQPLDAIIRGELSGDRVRLFVWPNLIKPGARLVYGRGCNPPALLADARDCAVPVTGPLSVEGELVPGPGFVTWAGGITVHELSLATLDAATVATLARRDPPRSHGEPWWPEFVNLHAHWQGRAGVACFFTEFDARASDKRVLLGFGYDGPVRLWLDDREIHSNPFGSNPCVVDQHILPVSLRAGRHRLALALDVNGGRAWGFALRPLAPARSTRHRA